MHQHLLAEKLAKTFLRRGLGAFALGLSPSASAAGVLSFFAMSIPSAVFAGLTLGKRG